MSETTGPQPAVTQEKDSEPALLWKGIPPTAEENARRIKGVMDGLPSSMNDQARMIVWRVEKVGAYTAYMEILLTHRRLAKPSWLVILSHVDLSVWTFSMMPHYQIMPGWRR